MCTLPGFVENSMDCYKLYSDPKSWSDAEASCQKTGTHLVSVLTVYEQAFIDMLSASLSSPVWIGMSDLKVIRLPQFIVHIFIFHLYF